jgi:hypothetical protein
VIDPPRIQVIANSVGTTPAMVTLPRRKKHYAVRYALEGHTNAVTRLEPRTNPWVYANILMLPGLFVDHVNANSRRWPEAAPVAVLTPAAEHADSEPDA